MRCRHCKGELTHHYAAAYKCDDCGRVFDMFEEESFEDLKNQIEKEKEVIAMRNNIAGEVQFIMAHLTIPYHKTYLKMFRTPELVLAIKRQVARELPQYNVILKECEDEWILSVDDEPIESGW